jgi:hypothetical protein
MMKLFNVLALISALSLLLAQQTEAFVLRELCPAEHLERTPGRLGAWELIFPLGVSGSASSIAKAGGTIFSGSFSFRNWRSSLLDGA